MPEMINNLLDIKLPVFQAPMAGVQGSELAVAVSSAGGLGALPAAMLGSEVPTLLLHRTLISELGPVCGDAPAFPLATAGVAPLRTAAEKHGSGDFSPLWSGQNVSGCRETPAGELTKSLCSDLKG